MCRTGNQGRDRPETRYVICTGQEDSRRGYGLDAGCMTKVRGEREHKVRQGPGVTSGLQCRW